MADIISDLRLVTLLPTENQTIYAFNVDNPKEFYTESFFAKMGTTWAFCVIPDRSTNEQDYYINILQSNNQTITVNAIIPDIVTHPEFRAGILNYYSTNLLDKYTYTISYQQIRVFATAVERVHFDIEYRYIEPIQVDHQLILIVNEFNGYYSYGVELPYDSKWKAIMIVEAGYIPGHMTVQRDIEEEPTELDDYEIVERTVDYNTKVSATPATEKYTPSTMKVGLFDNSTIDHSNSDGYLRIGIGTDTNKKITTILLYNKDKIEYDSLPIGTDEEHLLHAVLGTVDDYKATNIVYQTASTSKRVLSALEGYYGFDYILGYAQTVSGSTLSPTSFTNGIANINIRAFGFGCEKTPVNDASNGYYFLVIDKPNTDRWTYIKIMIFDGKNKIFTMIAYREYFEEIIEGQFIGQYIYKQDSKNGINDDVYLFLMDKFNSIPRLNNVSIGVYVY